jgi:hypothetical protein
VGRAATVEQHGYAQCHHHAPLSALLLSAVHLVTLYKHTQPSTSPLKVEELCDTVSARAGDQTTFTLPLQPPQCCNVYDAPYIRRCWCSSDAEHTRGTLGGSAPIVKVARC